MGTSTTAGSVRLNGAALRAIRSRTIDPHTGRPYTGIGFASAAKLSQPHLCLLENDGRKASTAMVHRIAAALEVPPAAIMWAPPARGSAEDEAVA